MSRRVEHDVCASILSLAAVGVTHPGGRQMEGLAIRGRHFDTRSVGAAPESLAKIWADLRPECTETYRVNAVGDPDGRHTCI